MPKAEGSSQRWPPPRQSRDNLGYNSVLHSLADRGESLAKVEEWLEHMQESNVELSVQSYNHVLKACAKDTNGQKAESWLAKMKERQVSPNVLLDERPASPCERWQPGQSRAAPGADAR